jgi:hypothetical protein
MKIFLTLRRLFARRPTGAIVGRDRAPLSDPLDHPALKRMSLLELADLPFNRTCCEGRR